MKITKQTVAAKIAAYLRQDVTTDELVDWAENALMEGDFQTPGVAKAVARLGVADVRAFGLDWEECKALLRRLGYKTRVEVVVA